MRVAFFLGQAGGVSTFLGGLVFLVLLVYGVLNALRVSGLFGKRDAQTEYGSGIS